MNEDKFIGMLIMLAIGAIALFGAEIIGQLSHQIGEQEVCTEIHRYHSEIKLYSCGTIETLKGKSNE